MITFLYTLLSFACALLLSPLILLTVFREKYRQRLGQRLGLGLRGALASLHHHQAPPTFWCHALSVGEVTSALPLINALRKKYPQGRIVVSVTTRSGQAIAQNQLQGLADAIIPAPLDVGPVAPYFLRLIQPDLFIQVETDFWPHWLWCLRAQQIPALLVNGRISTVSHSKYQRFKWIFSRMFSAFSILSMQTVQDRNAMVSLGLPSSRVRTLGNLKFGLQANSPSSSQSAINRTSLGLSETAPVWICGSTHKGEEEQILHAYRTVQQAIKEVQLIIAPRNIERSQEIAQLIQSMHLTCRLWTRAERQRPGPILLLDTIGILPQCYRLADLAFIGGSLVAQGGHNPLEPAAVGVPVLYGPYMEDFLEIAKELIQEGGASQVHNSASLAQAVLQLVQSTSIRLAMGSAAQHYIQRQQGVIPNHLAIIDQLLSTVHRATSPSSSGISL